MQALLPIVRGLAEMFGPDCEVVLHDVRRLPHSIVAIENGAVSGRTVGDVPTDRMLRNLRNTDETQDVRLYISSQDGKILKSLAVTLRDEDGEPIRPARPQLRHLRGRAGSAHPRQLHRRRAPGQRCGPPRPVRSSPATSATWSPPWSPRPCGEMGKTPAAMTREEKMEVVKRLEERGAFLVKRSAEQVAEALDLSRYTIFAYLKEIRRGDAGGTGASPAGAPHLRRQAMTGAGTAGLRPDAATVEALYDIIAGSGARSLAVVGLVKNAGKTTVVNALMANCPAALRTHLAWPRRRAHRPPHRPRQAEHRPAEGHARGDDSGLARTLPLLDGGRSRSCPSTPRSGAWSSGRRPAKAPWR